MELFEFVNTLKTNTEQKKYNETLDFFKKNKESVGVDIIKTSQSVLAPMLKALRHSKNPEHGLAFIDQFGYIIDEKTDLFTLSEYTWLLYNIIKKENNGLDTQDENEELEETFSETTDLSRSQLLVRIETLLPLYSQGKNKFVDSAAFRLFHEFYKMEKVRSSKNWKLLEEFSAKFDPQKLSIECFSTKQMMKGVMKTVEFASDQETWFAIRTKALLELKRFEECIELSEKALEEIPKFHYQNNVWMARKIALSRKALGQKDEAVLSLKKILQRKQEWFILKELAELLFESNEVEEAYQSACNGMMCFGELESKVNLVLLLGKILQQKNDPENAYKHYLLLQLLRQQEGKSLSFEVQQLMNNVQTDPLKTYTLKALEQELRQVWSKAPSLFQKKPPNNKTLPKRNAPNADEALHTGKVIKILNKNDRGVNGFIKSDLDQRQYYFTVPANKEISKQVQLNDVYSFSLKTNPDGKTNALLQF